MKKVRFRMLLVLAGLVLSFSACSKALPADRVPTGESVEASDGDVSQLLAADMTESAVPGWPETSASGDAGQGNAVSGDGEPETLASGTSVPDSAASEGVGYENAASGASAPSASLTVGGTSGISEVGSNRVSGVEQGEESQIADGLEELEIHFLDVGQGDCTLLLCGGEAMLIDAGGNDQGTSIQSYLQKRDINTLKYVVCTHPDEDHIGGMDVILYKFDCETIFMTDEEKDTNTYRDVVDTMTQRYYQRTQPVVGETYTLGDASFTILGPAEIGSDSNNNSIALLLTHGSNRFLFTGDAEEEEEAQILESGISLEADVYKAGHHGSRTSSSQEFLDAVDPDYVVISCGENNSYGHPHAETMNKLRAMGVEVFRTDEQGSIVLSSDGSEIKWNCSPSDTWQAGEPVGGSSVAASEMPGDSREEAQPEESAPGAVTQPGESVPDAGAVTQPGESDPGAGAAVPSGEAAMGAGAATQSGEAASGASAAESDLEQEVSAPEKEQNSAAVSYICNTNTKKFHYPDCSSVKKMKEKNKLPVTTTREALIEQGYDPCKVCKP